MVLDLLLVEREQVPRLAAVTADGRLRHGEVHVVTAPVAARRSTSSGTSAESGWPARDGLAGVEPDMHASTTRAKQPGAEVGRPIVAVSLGARACVASPIRSRQDGLPARRPSSHPMASGRPPGAASEPPVMSRELDDLSGWRQAAVGSRFVPGPVAESGGVRHGHRYRLWCSAWS